MIPEQEEVGKRYDPEQEEVGKRYDPEQEVEQWGRSKNDNCLITSQQKLVQVPISCHKPDYCGIGN